jgi:formimidoylglutamate deiminase
VSAAATLFAPRALLSSGWAENVRILIDAAGDIREIRPGASSEGAERVTGTVLPGMPNLHSHAFQRAMAGLTERAGPGEDSFWTWREVMYRFVARLEPEDVRAVAAQLYVEMLKAGYTAVGEFHYVHHDRDGTPYADRATMAEAVAAAAAEAGIGITLLPVLYQNNGFGGVPPAPGQRRFVMPVEDFVVLFDTLRARFGGQPDVAVGVAPHSIRALTPEALDEAVHAADVVGAPIHIHVAEQVREVEECIAWSGRRSVEWLLDRYGLGERWCLVHATHISAEEGRRLAASGAVAGLAPTTEANLGDGIFPFRDYLAAGGRWGIGSDSHVSVSPVEELRWLEYGQRLVLRRRTIAAPRSGSTAAPLWRGALAGGAAALGRPVGALEAGRRADLIVLDDELPALWGKTGDDLLDAAVFAGNLNPVRHVMVGGRWVVRDGRHPREEAVLAAYRKALDRLLGESP